MQEKQEKLVKLPIILKAHFEKESDLRSKEAKMVQVPIKLKAVRGEITSFMIRNFKLTQLPRLKATKGQITSI